MHIPDGYLGPKTYITLYAVFAVFMMIAIKKLKKQLSLKLIPFLGFASAFSFLIMMFNIPIPGGTTGHAVGAALAGLVIGPWAAMVSVSVALIIQALVFGDGGITAIGANCFTMAIVMPFIAAWTYKLIAGNTDNKRRTGVAAFFAGYVSLNSAALITAVLFGLQPIISTDAAGNPLYSPYPLKLAVPAMALEHLLLFGIIEGIVTMVFFQYLKKANPELVGSK